MPLDVRDADLPTHTADVRLVFEAMLELAVFHEIVYGDDGQAVDYRILDCNPAFTRITGISREGAVGRLASEVYRTSPPYLDVYALVAATGHPARFETYFAPLDRHFSISVVSPRRGRFATIATDITDQQHSLRALRRYELLAEKTQDLVLFVRLADGRIIDANAAAVAAYGYTHDELRSMSELALCEHSAAAATPSQAAGADGGAHRYETTHRTKTGRRFPVEVSSAGATLDGTPVIVSVVRDISERRRAEERLAAERERLEVTLRSIGDGVIATDDGARITLMNEVAERLTGWRAAEAEGKPLREVFRIVSEATRQPAVDPVDRVLREGVVVGLANHTALVARDGSVRPIADSGAPIRDSSGRTSGVVLVFRDVTEDREADRAQAHLAAVVESSDDAIISKDLQGTILTWNAGAERLLGYRPEEVVGRRIDVIIPSDRLAEEDDILARIREGERVQRYHTRRVTKAGTLVEVSITVSPVRDQSGQIVAASKIMRDVTERRRLEEELRYQRDLNESVTRNAAESIFVTDELGRTTFANQEAQRVFGFTMAELKGRVLHDVIHGHLDGRRRAHEQCPSARSQAGETIRGWEDVFYRKDGAAIDVSCSSAPLELGGRKVGCVLIAHDVSEQKRSERALRESERRFRAIFEQAAVGMAEVDVRTGRFLSVNEKLCDILGYSREELATRSWEELTYPDDLSRDRESYAEMLASHSSFSKQKRYVRKDGRVVWGKVTVSPMWPAGSDPTTHVAVVEDVTDSKRAAEALRESEERFRILADGSPVILWVSDARGGHQFINRTFRDFFGVTLEQVEGDLWQSLFHPDDAPEYVGAYFEALRDRAPFRAEARARDRNGQWRWVSTHAQPRYSQTGEFLGHVGITMDVTERKETEDALRRRDAFYHALLKGSPDFLSVRGRDGRDKFLSSGVSTVVGWTAEELLAQEPFAGVHPDDRERVMSKFRSVLAEPGGIRKVKYRMRHKDGSWRVLDTVARNLLDDPDVQGIVVNRRDVTEQLLLQEQLQQSQKLESVGRLAGGIAHDFNNLLTVILSGAEALKLDLRSNSLPDAEVVEEIAGAGARARDLTRQLLTFARRQVISPVLLDVNDLLRGSEKLLRRVLGEDVELVAKLAAGLGRVRCDPGQLEQVVMNLAVNARDAMPRGGRLVIETSNCEVDVALSTLFPGIQPGAYVRLAVHDSGTGMSAHVKAHVFEPFFTTKPVGTGTGLGLATVYGIVKQSGGFIRVESEANFGTTVEVLLPRVGADAAPVDAAAIPAAGVATTRGTEMVLVVEDDPQVRRVTLRTLERAGYRAFGVSSGDEALAHLGRHPDAVYDLVVTDIVMPGLDGRAFVTRLQELTPQARVLFVSGYTRDVIATRGVLDEGVQFLQKPFTPAALLEHVRAVLDSGR